MSGRKMVDSGVEWIGHTPNNWTIARLKDVSESNPKTILPDKGEISFVPMQQLGFGMVDGSEGTDATNPGSYTKFSDGDILIAKVTPCFENGKIAIAKNLIGGAGLGSSEIVPIRAHGIDSRYLMRVMQTSEFIEIGTSTMNGTAGLQRVSTSFWRDTPTPLPPLAEQQAIANFLDHHVDLIDRERVLIAKKIELLKDKRQAAIFECVTGKRQIVEAQHLAGVDDWSNIISVGHLAAVPTPEDRLVDSGVDWIGEVPEGWNISRVGLMFKVDAGIPAPTNAEPMRDGLVPFVRVSDLARNPGRILIETRDGIPGPCRTYPPGTVVLPKSGESIRTGVRKILVGGQAVVGHLACLIPNNNSGYGYWLMEILDFEEETNQTALPSLNLSAIGRKTVPLPPPSEQLAISDFLDRYTNLIDRETSLLKSKLDILSSKRQSLIFEAVTGKMKIKQEGIV